MRAEPVLLALRAGAVCAGLLLASLPAQAGKVCQQWLDDGPAPLPGCRADGDQLRLAAPALARLQHDADGLAVIWANARFYYHHRNGRLLQVATLDNGPDAFQRGLVRGVLAGRYGYYDRTLAQRIAPQFDGALPFDPASDSAAVCLGCHPLPTDADGQHSFIGGRHWRINIHGHPLP